MKINPIGADSSRIRKQIFEDILNPCTGEPIIAANRQAAIHKKDIILEKMKSKVEKKSDNSPVRSAGLLLHNIEWTNSEEYFSDLAEQ